MFFRFRKIPQVPTKNRIELKATNLSNKLIKRLVEGTRKQSKRKSVAQISNIRDQYLLDLLLMRKKYEKKLR